MIREAVSFLPLAVLVIGGSVPFPAGAVESCRVRVGKDGTVGISASKVTGVVLWGGDSSDATRTLVDQAACTVGTRLRNCLIGSQGTLASKTPPSTCELHLADDGPDTCSARIRGCTPGLRLGSAGNATYRWMVFSSYSQSWGWYANNGPDLFGGVSPSNWGDNNALADQMSADKEVLRTLFTRKGFADKNATVAADEWYSTSSTNSRHVATLFRIANSTQGDIVWDVDVYQTAFAGWGERASVALNGVLVWESGGASLGPHQSQSHSLTIPAGRTSTVIFLSASTTTTGGGSCGGFRAQCTRSVFMAFHNDTLDLPPGLAYVDDLDDASGGWDE
jgi:hypothetical protein